MTYVITEQLSVVPLNSYLLPCSKDEATYQREKYNTTSAPNKTAVAISEYSGRFSYSVGDSVDIMPRLYLSRDYKINNVIITNKFAREMLKQGR